LKIVPTWARKGDKFLVFLDALDVVSNTFDADCTMFSVIVKKIMKDSMVGEEAFGISILQRLQW
jgi:hypothetical protein